MSDANWALIRERAVTVWLDVDLPVVIARSGSGAEVDLGGDYR